jgi:F0F1-type ATP synthase membrane subunit c/vacuolar-type H+-ATPase subunit K
MVFLVGMKILAASICILPLGGCALGVGLIFCGLLYGISRNPSAYDSVFSLSLLGLAMIELFAFICVICAGAAFFLV